MQFSAVTRMNVRRADRWVFLVYDNPHQILCLSSGDDRPRWSIQLLITDNYQLWHDQMWTSPRRCTWRSTPSVRIFYSFYSISSLNGLRIHCYMSLSRRPVTVHLIGSIITLMETCRRCDTCKFQLYSSPKLWSTVEVEVLMRNWALFSLAASPLSARVLTVCSLESFGIAP